MTKPSTPIVYFKKEAKKLFRSVQANVPEAMDRVRLVLHDMDEVTLTRVQHVVAVENGFLKWLDLIAASPAELADIVSKKKLKRPLELPERTRTPLGNFYRRPGLLPPAPEHLALADMFDSMTYDEQRRYLDEDARLNFGM